MYEPLGIEAGIQRHGCAKLVGTAPMPGGPHSPFEMVENRALQAFHGVFATGEFHKCVEVVVELRSERSQIVDPTVVSEPSRGVPRGHDALDAAMGGIGVEVHRCGGGEEKRALRRVEAAVGNPKAVAREDTPCLVVHDAVMMLGVAGRVQEAEHSITHRKLPSVVGLQHPIGVDRRDRTVEALKGLFTVHSDAACHQTSRIDHVPSATRVHHKGCPRQSLHERSGSPRMIQVNVGEDQVRD